MSFFDKLKKSKENKTSNSKNQNIEKSNYRNSMIPQEYEYLKQATELSNNRQFYDAIDVLDKALDINPNNPGTLISKAICLHSVGEEKESIIFFNKAYTIDPTNNVVQKATPMFDEIKDDYFYEGLNRIQRLNSSREDKIREIDKLLELDPKSERLLLNKGLMFYHENRHDEAADCFLESINFIDEYHSPGQKQTIGAILGIRGAGFDSKGQYEEAIKYFDGCVRLYPCAENYFNRGVVLTHMSRYNEALQCYDKAIELNPDYDDARNYKNQLIDLMKQ